MKITKEILDSNMNNPNFFDEDSETGSFIDVINVSYRDFADYKDYHAALDEERKVVESQNYGDGHERWKIIHFPKLDLYVKVEGVYSSWGASTWDECYYVKPKQVTVTQFFKVGES